MPEKDMAMEPVRILRERSASLRVTPLAAVERVRGVLDAFVWRSSSNDPQLLVAGDTPWSGPGHYLFEVDVLSIGGCSGIPVLYFDFGEGFSSSNALPMRRTTLSHKPYSIVVRMAERPRQIRLDPCSSPGEFLCSEVVVSAISDARARTAGTNVFGLPRSRVTSSFVDPVASDPGLQPETSPALPRIGAILHLFYDDLWPELSRYLGHIPSLERLYVSVPEGAPADMEERIVTAFPCALVRRVPNRGRDMLPFLQWLEVAARQGIDLICKIHAKRSAHLPAGDAWRRDLLDKLLGSNEVVADIVASFRADPALGIVGPGGHLVPTSYFSGRSAAGLHELCLHMGRDFRNREPDYVAGSMFWARVEALLPLRRFSLRDEQFEAENGANDDTMANALEQCVPIAAELAGFRIGETANPTETAVRDFAPPALPQQGYLRWIEAFEPKPSDHVHFVEAQSKWTKCPLISIVMPTFNTPEEVLIAALDSVIGQVYPFWELCIADDASTQTHVRSVLERYRQAEPRIKVAYRERNGHISAASNSALALASGDFVALLDHDDELHPLALHYVAEAIAAHPGCELVYTDEDKLGLDGRRQDPYFKCDLNYELLLAHNMICHLAAYRTARVRKLGGFREGFEGSQDYDLVLRFLEGLDPGKVIHVPRVLYHWRVAEGSTAQHADEKPYAQIAARKAIAEHLERVGTAGTVEAAPEAPAMNRVRFAVPKPQPSVAIVIPTRDRADLLGLCVDSLLARTTYGNYSIVIVDNGSTERASLALFERLRKAGVTIVRDEAEFNFSAINNRAVHAVSSEFVCLMNNDIEVLTPDWLEEMVGMAARPGVGAVGARLWYPDKRLQHGGVIVGLGGVAGHSHKYFSRGDVGYFFRAVLHQSLSAVTAACLLIRRSVYEEVGGLDESLRVAFNDVDFCLRVRAAGYRNVWTPYAEMIHHESASRGHETTPEKQARFSDEMLQIKARWGEGLLRDPAYSPNLTLDSEDFRMAWPPRVEALPPSSGRT